VADTKQRTALAELVERHRRDLAERTDISQAMRKLSQSSGRNPIGPTKKKPRSTALTLLIVVPTALVMVICVASAALALAGNLWLQSQLSDPSTTVQKYYAALHQQNYSEAWSYFSSDYQKAQGEDTFSNKTSLFDNVNGAVDSYIVTGSAVGSQTATFTVMVLRRGNDMAQVQTLKLVKDSDNTWHIDAVAIGANVPAPTPTA
jgi:hypothetical protein